MLIFLSPSKSFTSRPRPFDVQNSKTMFSDESQKLLSKLQSMSSGNLTSTLGVSDKLGKLNYNRYKQWNSTPVKAAIWNYSGDVYNGLDAFSMTLDDIKFAKEKILIISGLYGLLKPLDGIKPYRLEMKLKLYINKHHNLYEYWSEPMSKFITNYRQENILVCASKEYSSAILPLLDDSFNVLVPRFFQQSKDGFVEKGLFSKYARGALARWVIDKKIEDPSALKEYCGDGFMYNAELSSQNELAFIMPANFTLKGRFQNWKD